MVNESKKFNIRKLGMNYLIFLLIIFAFNMVVGTIYNIDMGAYVFSFVVFLTLWAFAMKINDVYLKEIKSLKLEISRLKVTA
jgi:hypothetical protein